MRGQRGAGVPSLSILLLLLSLLTYVRTKFAIAVVENNSMSPTLPPGSRVLITYWWPARWLRKGSVVLIKPFSIHGEQAQLLRETYIKRVVAVPGETLTTHLEDVHPFLREGRTMAKYSDLGYCTWVIPANHYFVRGDYPIGGYDSLTWGPVPFHVIDGVMIAKLSLSQ